MGEDLHGDAAQERPRARGVGVLRRNQRGQNRELGANRADWASNVEANLQVFGGANPEVPSGWCTQEEEDEGEGAERCWRGIVC